LTEEEAKTFVRLLGGTIEDEMVLIPKEGVDILRLLELIGDVRIDPEIQNIQFTKRKETKMEKIRDIDSKFAISGNGAIFKKSNEEVVPDDEPLFLLRGRDVLAIELLFSYFLISAKAGCTAYHYKKLGETIEGFIKFKREHPERMKMPSITEGEPG
jgi:hypothetical protein